VTSTRTRHWDLVVKVGGSLGRAGDGLRPIMRALAAAARRRRILVVPGGGRFADQVRYEMRRLGLPEARAHEMALLAMDQYAHILAHHVPGAKPVRSLAASREVARRGRLPILLAGGLAARADGRGAAGAGLERSFRLTSDSIAAWIAGRVGPRGLLLLKSVPDLDRVVGSRADAARAARRGLVDPLFARHLPRGGVAVRLLDARRAGLRETLRLWPPEKRSRSGARRGRSRGAGDRDGPPARPSRARRGRR
jgi:5-(aminomethyl)-3-furanmethanol phosphate kinase